MGAMKLPIMSEADMAARVVAHLESEGYEVFHEVTLGDWKDGVAPRADIVATRDSSIITVECKKVLSFEVLAQAERWLP